jgi:Zn-dependent protease with chaperone function
MAMQCPNCSESILHQRSTKQGTMVDECPQCHGLWLESGKVLGFSPRPRQLAAAMVDGLKDRQPSAHQCPRCRCALERGGVADLELHAESCPDCGGLWFEAQEVRRVVGAGDLKLEMPVEPPPEVDPEAQARAHERMHGLAVGLLALPNLFLRSVLTLAFLYGLVALVLITLSLLGYLDAAGALAIGIVIALLQFALGPFLMDLGMTWLYKFRWLKPEEMPGHLREFVAGVCNQHKMRFPSFGLIDDGAPAAFTYGHHPSNARVVISRGLMELLEPAELEAVVAHELGHARNWDMALMTVAYLVPLLLYFLYRVATERVKDKDWGVAAGAFVLYIVSQYIVLWFSRTREYFADRFAGQVTNNPNALASALVKIAYGLAAQPGVEQEEAPTGVKDKGKKQKTARVSPIEALGALNISDRRGSVGLVMASARDTGTGTGTSKLDVNQIKGAMQWDLWNPWATYYELHSTHPLVAKRLRYLGDQAAHQGQEPLVVFDRKRPESYWDDFLFDVGVMVFPWVCFLAGVGMFVAMLLGAGVLQWWWLAAGVGLAGLASLAKTRFVYRKDFFPHLSIAALLHKVKVSAVRPVPATLTP